MRAYLRLLIFALVPSFSFASGLIPHVTGAGDEVGTLLILENTLSEAKVVTVVAHDSDGAALDEVEVVLDAHERLLVPAAEYLPVGTSHLVLEDQNVSLSVAYGEAGNTLFASNDAASSWEIADPDHRVGRQSLLVVNRGSEPADVWAYQHDVDGTLRATVKLAEALAPMAKVTVSPADVFEALEGDTVRVAATQLLSVSSLRRNFSQDGTMKMQAEAAVAKSTSTSTRDERGVWYVKGGSLYDAFEMMAYNIATDRLWQGEVFRRTGRGRLAEIFGADLAGQDVSVRSTGYSDAELENYLAESHEDTQIAINAYVDGFNRRIAEVNSDPISLLPFEFKALGHTSVENWSIHDVMAWTSLLQRNFSSLGNLGFGQVANALNLLELVGKYGGLTGSAIFSDTTWRNDPGAPVMIPDPPVAEGKTAYDAEAELAQLRQLLNGSKTLHLNKLGSFRQMVESFESNYDYNVAQLKKVGGYVKGGSYAWAIAGSKTASGNPVVYSGPQMGFSAPAIVLEGSIETESITVSGMTVVGIPAIIIGRTPHHAWSMQVGHTNTWDFYVEPPEAVELHHVETVKVLGGEDISVPVFRSSHGPVVAQEPFILSWKYSGWGREWRLAEGNLALARAQSMEEFGQGVANLAVTQHFCYADRDGNIGYWHSGFNPVRPPGEYRLPQGLLGAPLEWEGYQEPVHDANTHQGFYAGWNNKARSDQFDYSGTYRYGQYHRAWVPQGVIRGQEVMTFEDIKDVAVNIAATQAFASGSGSGGGNLWEPVAAFFGEAVEAHPSDERLAALSMMRDWDGHYVAGGPDQWVFGMDVNDAWVLISKWVEEVSNDIFSDEVGAYTGKNTRFNMLLREINSHSPRRNHYRKYMRNEADASASTNLHEIVVNALDRVLASLGDKPWGAGARGYIEYGNNFGLPIPPTPWGARSTYAHVVEYGPEGPVRIESVFPLGESGFINIDGENNLLFDPHFFSMKELYDIFTLRPFPMFEGTYGLEE